KHIAEIRESGYSAEEYQLANGRLTGTVPGDFLLFTDSYKHGVFYMDVATQRVNAIPITNISNPIAVDYDLLEERIFWTDVILAEINSISINGSGQKNILKSQGSILDGLAIDSELRLLFYTDTGKHEIVKMKLAKTEITVLFDSSVEKPRDIELDSSRRKLYWTDWGLNAKIETAYYDGTNRKTIVNTNLKWPNGIALDHEAEIIYWCDGGTGNIEKSYIDGTNRQIVHRAPGSHFFGLALYGDILFYTHWGTSSVMTVSTNGSNLKAFGPSQFGRLNDIHVFSNNDIDDCQSLPCHNNGNCTDAVNDYHCTCNVGFTGRTCETDIDDCQSLPCHNNGNCTDAVNDYHCTCNVGFTGRTCETDKDDCQSLPCHNNGNCTDAVNDYHCTCNVGFTGRTCETEMTDQVSYLENRKMYMIIGVSIGTVFIAIIIASVVVVVKKKRNSGPRINDTQADNGPGQELERGGNRMSTSQLYVNVVEIEGRWSNTDTGGTGDGYYSIIDHPSRHDNNIYDKIE
ncbi:low-density lipoprotein receptor-related protein 4-like, partial [Ruditapes philippinarum]|uniref:low-density lipoprotein receptor-related protein 4-like n=1 Tax=Ruditapes philippinarum TaxID=129788 RepID=UPI00295B5A69